MTIFKKIFLAGILLGLVLLPHSVVLAQYGLSETAGAAGLTDGRYPDSIPVLIGNVIGTALSMIAVIFFILMVYGGFMWMTAHGDSGQIDKAKDTIIAAVIGIIVVLASYAITNFVFKAVDGGGPAPSAGGGGGGNLPTDDSRCVAKGQDFACHPRAACDPDTVTIGLCPGSDYCCQPIPVAAP